MLLNDIVETSRRVGEVSARLAKIDLLAACLKRARAGEIDIAIAWLSGGPRQGRIGLGYAALRDATGSTAVSTPLLTLAEVDAVLERVQHVRGSGSGSERQRVLGDLFGRATRDEQAFLARLILGELRQGALEGLMMEAIARAAALPVADIRRGVMLAGSMTTVGHAALTEGGAGLARFSVELFRPVRPMLAQTAADVADALVRLPRASFEYKLDGARVQVHKAGSAVRIFSRELNDVTESAPEIVDAVANLAVDELILDGEAIAVRPDGMPQPFQVTMRRFGRKLDVDAMRGNLPLKAHFFDCLYLDRGPLIDRPQSERFGRLGGKPAAGAVNPAPGHRRRGCRAGLPRTGASAWARGRHGEGARFIYEAGGRGAGWLKIKRTHTLDLVVLAAEWGHGRRRGWLSNLHLGARDGATGNFVMLGKTFKGMTDAMLDWQTRHLQELAIERDSFVVHVRPELVVEIAFNDIQASPHYPAGMALRFARVKRYRTDKRPEEADTIDMVRALFHRQAGHEAPPSPAP